MALLVAGIGECRVSRDPADVLITHALGSCIAVVLHDPVARVAGLLHYMLPESSLDPERAATLPCLFADTGIPLLLESAFLLGALKSRIVIMAAGGAQMTDITGAFNIGQRNFIAMKEIFAKAGIRIHRAEIGGTTSRTVSVDVATGRVRIQTPGQAKRELTASGGNLCPL